MRKKLLEMEQEIENVIAIEIKESVEIKVLFIESSKVILEIKEG